MWAFMIITSDLVVKDKVLIQLITLMNYLTKSDNDTLFDRPISDRL